MSGEDREGTQQAPELEVDDSRLANRGHVASPDSQRPWRLLVIEETAGDSDRCVPRLRHSPSGRERIELLPVGGFGKHSGIDNPKQPNEGVVCPQVCGHHERVVRRREREDPVDAESGRLRPRKKLIEGGRRQAVNPFRIPVKLDIERDFGHSERSKVMRRLWVKLRRAGLKSGRE